MSEPGAVDPVKRRKQQRIPGERSQMAHMQPAVAFLAMRDVSYVQIARETGVHVETVRRTMRGTHRPNQTVVDWCVRLLGLPAEVLFRVPVEAA